MGRVLLEGVETFEFLYVVFVRSVVCYADIGGFG